jgi:hypothetical protein
VGWSGVEGTCSPYASGSKWMYTPRCSKWWWSIRSCVLMPVGDGCNPNKCDLFAVCLSCSCCH